MSYLGNLPTYGDTTSNFKILDDISSYTLTFDGSSASVVSVTDDTITQNSHRFITGQRVTYATTGSVIGNLPAGVYYIIKNDQNTIKLATSLSNANNNVAVNFTALGTGTTHTLNVAFDGINTKFKATYDNGTKALFTRAAQLQISINGVIQQPQDTTTPTNGFGFDLDGIIIFSVPPVGSDVFWGNVIANNFAAYDISDNKVDNFTGNGSTTLFILSQEVPNNESLLVTIDGVVQYPSDGTTSRAYSVYDNQLIFTAAPGNGTVIQARHIGFAGAVTSSVTGFYGRTGNVTLTSGDNITAGIGSFTGIQGIGIQSTGVNIATGIITALNFVGAGNTFAYNVGSKTVDINIGGSQWTFVDSSNTSSSGIYRLNGNVGLGTTNPQQKLDVVGNAEFSGSVGVNTTTITRTALTGVGNSFNGVYISNGMMIMDNTLNGNHYIGTNFNGLMAGPVTINGTLTVDGNYVVV